MPQINLRTVLPSDTIGGMVEKLNYNFQQIILAGGGPQGIDGLIGAPGLPGPIGSTGDIGATGATGTYLYVGLTAPDLISLTPVPREMDVYIQTISLDSSMVFWQNDGTGASGWSIVETLSMPSGVYLTTKDPVDEADPGNVSTFADPSIATGLFVADNYSGTNDGPIFQDAALRRFDNFLSQSTGTWLAGFASQGNQIRLVNSDPLQLSTTDPILRSNDYAGALLSLETYASGDAEMLLTLKDARILGGSSANKLFSIKLNDDVDGTTSFYADTNNNAAVGAIEGATLNNKFSVFGNIFLNNSSYSRLKIDAANGGSSRLELSIGELQGSKSLLWFIDANGANNSFLAIGASVGLTGSSYTGNSLLVGLTSGDSRVNVTGLLSIGNINPVSELEIGATSEGRVGIGQIEPGSANSFATSYLGFNTFRYRGTTASSSWLQRGGGGNAGSIIWNSNKNNLLAINIQPTSSTGDRLLTGDSWITNGAILFKRGSTSYPTKLFINSAGYSTFNSTDTNAAPEIVIGAASRTNKFLTGKGIGLHGVGNAVEWLGKTGPGGSLATGFRILNDEFTDIDTSLLRIQSVGNNETVWRDSITIYKANGAGASASDGTVLIGSPVSNAGIKINNNSLLTIKGAGSGSSSVYINRNLLDIQLGAERGGEFGSYPDYPTVFRLDQNGDVTAGLKFGNTDYDSKDSSVLDHYREGTWNPYIYLRNGSTWVSTTGLTASLKKANYTRIGNQVTVDLAMKVYGMTQSSIPPTYTGDANIILKGFPFRPDFENVPLSDKELNYPLVDMNKQNRFVADDYPVSSSTVIGTRVYGGFVIEDKTKMYLYSEISPGNNAVRNLYPSDMGATVSPLISPYAAEFYSYLNGRFSYFIANDYDKPRYTGATGGNFVYGATGTTFSASWDEGSNSLGQPKSISSVAITTSIPAWLTMSAGSYMFSITPGATVASSGSSPIVIGLLATDSAGKTASGSVSFTKSA